MHTAHTHGALQTCTPDGAARGARLLLLRPAQAHLSHRAGGHPQPEPCNQCSWIVLTSACCAYGFNP